MTDLTIEQQQAVALAEAERQWAEATFAEQAKGMDPIDLSIARSKNDEFGKYLRGQVAQRLEGETDEQLFRRLYGSLSEREIGLGEGITRAAVQGATFGAGDELVAGVSTGLDLLMDSTPGATAGEIYSQYLARERGDIRRFREDHPVAAIGSEVAGAIPTALAAPLGTARGATTLSRMAKGGAIGATEGGIYGFAAGEGGTQNRLLNAAQTGGLGAGVGVAAPAVAAGGRNIYNRLATGQAARQAGMSRPAYETITRVAEADDVLTGAGARRLAQAGPEAMLADAGPSTRQLLDTAMQTSGPAARTARTAINERVTRASRAINSAMDDAFGQPVGVRTIETGLRRSTAAARQDAYERAYNQAIDYASERGQAIERIVRTRVPQSAITRANRLMRAELGRGTRQIRATIGDDGSVVFDELPDVQQIDYITRGLNEVANEAQGRGAMGGTSQLGRAYGNLSRDLRNLVRDLVPEYGQALETAAEPISARNATRLGSQALSGRIARDELAEALGGMTGAERSHVALGMRSQIDEALANVRRTMTDTNMDAREAVQALRTLSSRASREKVAMVIGEDQATQLFAELDRAAMAFDLRAAVAENSKTFARQSMNEIVRGQTEEGVVNRLRSGSLRDAAAETIQVVAGRTRAAREQLADEAYGDVVNALVGPRGAEARNVLQSVTTSQSRIPGQASRIRSLVEYYGARGGAGGGAAALESIQ